MQSNQPFLPWMWRDTEMNRYGVPDESGSSATADERAASGLAGYGVEATDGSIGTVAEASFATDHGYLVVDTGPWIFGRKVLLPAGTVQHVDHEERTVYVDRTKDQIKHSPDYDENTFATAEYHQSVGSYYTSSYGSEPLIER